jgi:hypothetical protein
MLRASGASLCMPAWLTREREADLAVEYVILSCTGFVMENGHLSGSGFFAFVYEDEFTLTYFITAKHVVWNEWRKRGAKFPPDGEVTIRINRHRSGIKEINLKRSEWLYHEDRFVDLCAVPITEPEHRYLSEGDVSPIHITNLAASFSSPGIRAEQMMLGDEVFITGAFLQRLGETKNIPIVRTGNIAALCEEPVEFLSPRHPAYLVETRSLGGISGSPVWFDPTTRLGRSGRAWGPAAVTNAETGKTSEPTVIVPYRLVGMVLGTWSSPTDIDFVSREEAKTDAEWNTGISVVIPDFRIMEFLMSDSLKQHRIDAIAEREKRSGVRFTSAHPAPETKPESDENPDHRKDFNRLVSAASKSKPKGDQT